MTVLRRLLLLLGSAATGFVVQTPHARRLPVSRYSVDDPDDDAWSLLRKRQELLEQQESKQAARWRANVQQTCRSKTSLALPDWVRRVDVDYPLIACGSASGTVFVGNAQTGELLAASKVEDDTEDYSEEYQQLLDRTLHLLYGAFDGGGTLAISMDKTLICDARRSGGVRLHRVALKEGQVQPKLILQGSIPALEGVLVTSLQLEEDYLWVGRADGKVQAYAIDEDLPLAMQLEPELEWNLGNRSGIASPVLSVSICSQLSCAVASMASGSVEVISLCDDDDDEGRSRTGSIASFYPPFDSGTRKAANTYALSAIVVPHERTDEKQRYSIVCGGNDGSIFVQPLELYYDEIDLDQPFAKPLYQIRPPHFGPVVSLAVPSPGLLASAGQDGAIKVWELGDTASPQSSRCLYQFSGYKVWIGSLWTDGTRLISDGADNTVIEHDFNGSTTKQEDSK